MANFNIAYLIELKDRYSRIAEKVSKNNKFMQNTFERLKNSVSSINNVLDKAKAKLSAFGSGAKNIGESISGVGRNLAGATVAISGLFWKSLRNWEAQASAISTLEQALKTRQASLGMTSKELQDMASEMQKKSIFGDEGIIQNVTNQLLTFDKVNGDVFKRASQSVIDMTSKLYGANATVEQSRMLSLALGKALNTPAEAMNSLGRVGIRFNKDQQQIVKYLVQTGQTAKAQSYILKQLEDRYGGAAEALAKTQPLKVLANAFDDMLEPLGQIVQEFLVPLVKIGTRMIEMFNNLNKPIKVFIVSVMGIISIASPLLIIFGGVISAIGSISGFLATFIGVIQKWNIITKIATGIQMVFNATLWANPITWIVVAVIALIGIIVLAYQKVDWFRNLVDTLWLALQVLWSYIKLGAIILWQKLQPAIQAVSEWFSNVWAKVVEFAGAVKSLWSNIMQILAPVINFGKFIFLWLTPLGMVINVLTTLISKFDLIKKGIEKAKQAMQGFKSDADAKIEEKQREIKAQEANGSSKTDVNVTMKAEQGTKVTSTKVKSKGNNKPNVGVNQAGKGK